MVEWHEVDVKDWVRKWLDLNLRQAVLVEKCQYKVSCREAYIDNGEVVLCARQGKFNATYNMDIVVKWYAQQRLDGRIVGEARGRVRAIDVSPTGGPELVVEGDWQYRPQGPLQEPLEESDAETHLKNVVSAELDAFRARVSRLQDDLGELASDYDGHSCLPEPQRVLDLDAGAAFRAEQATAALVIDVKSKLRSPDFLPRLDEIRKGARLDGDFRCMSLTDADVPFLVEAVATTLETLDLSYNDISDAGLQPLIVALASGLAPHLTKLTLRHLRISDVARRQLKGLALLRKSLLIEGC